MAGEKIGSGRRFRGLEHKLAATKGVKNPSGLAAYLGRKKYGKARMAELAKAGARREETAAPAAEKPGRRTKV